MKNVDTQTKGDVSEIRVAAALRRMGYTVLFPFSEGEQYDLCADTGDEFVKVQVKYARLTDTGSVNVPCMCSNSSKSGNNSTFYTADQIDGIAAYCDELDRCFWIPHSDLNKYSFALSPDGRHTFSEYSIENLGS